MRLFFLAILLVVWPSFILAQENVVEGLRYGTIKSDDLYPQPYGDNINKTWRITVREGYRVHLYFTTFDLEDSYEDDVGACAYDYVQIKGYRRMCGNSKDFPMDAPRKLQVFKSVGKEMIIDFISDYSNEEPKPVGFEAHWSEEDVDECFDLKHAVYSGVDDWDQILYCNHFCHNVGGSYYCSCRPGFTLDENKHTCVANCEAEVPASNEGGSMESTDYPQYYGKLSDCQTVLQAGVGMRMDVQFNDTFEIEDHYEEGCVYDWLQITDDQGNEAKYCGSVAPENGSWIVLNTNFLRLHFFSDLSVEKLGYKIHYRIYPVKCGEVLQAPENGSISSNPDEEFIYNDAIYFKCDRGFRLVGSSVSVCSETGEWSTRPPTCNIKHCPRNDQLLNLRHTNPPVFEEEERPYNSRLTIPCNDTVFFQVQSGSSEWFCDDDEEWHPVPGTIVSPNNVTNNYPECRPICGIKNARSEIDFFIERDPFTGLILGGRDAAREGEFPWMTFIDIGDGGLNTTRLDTFCGGSLVDEQYVVTAAHCFSFRPDTVITGSSLNIYLGVTNRFNTSNPNVQIFHGQMVSRHEDFASNIRSLFDHDIAVIKLDRPAVIGRYVRPICLPRSPAERNLPQTSENKGVVIGWGATVLDEPSHILQVVRVPYVNATYCSEVYRDQSSDNPSAMAVMINDGNHFCAGTLDQTKDACDGDSGGPLMWRNTQRQWFLNGIISFGTSIGECEQYTIGVYTNVSNYGVFLANNIMPKPFLNEPDGL